MTKIYGAYTQYRRTYDQFIPGWRVARESSSFLCVFVALFLCLATLAQAQNSTPVAPASVSNLSTTDDDFYISIRTDSPRRTLTSFIRLREQLEVTLRNFEQQKSRQSQTRASALLRELGNLTDLSEVPRATIRDVRFETVLYMLDILGRVQLPAMQDVALSETDDGEDVLIYRIPGTPLMIELIQEGDRKGEYLFSETTIRTAPRFYDAIRGRQLQTNLEINSWSEALPQLTGWAIPAVFDRAISEPLKRVVWGTPIWKIFAVALVTGFAIWLFRLWNQFTGTLAQRMDGLRHFIRILAPIGVFPIVHVLTLIFQKQIIVAGAFASFAESVLTLVHYVALTILVWLCSLAVFEVLLLNPRISRRSLNANLLRLVSRIIGVFGGIVVLAFGAQNLGVPVFSIVAGLGVGGLAIALALRPTIENLIGGILLYLDKPVRVGDFCSFGDSWGTIEDIGVRSTQIRALDGTRVSIPNAQFADMKLVNWSACKEMMIESTIGLRYETSTDQLRYVLVKLREMAEAHPKINHDKIRIRAKGFGTSSLDIEVRVYVATRDWNEFFEVREDLVFKTKEIVEASGTGFAFPSMTIYAARDKGLDKERSDASIEHVQNMRLHGNLPFPRYSDD